MTRVLIVGAREEDLRPLRALLLEHGYDVDEARHGAEALAKARSAPPSLVLSELLPSATDGYAFLRQWKADDRLKEIPFVAFAADRTEPNDERRARDLGADAFILKPAGPEGFLAPLLEVLARARAGGLAGPQPPSSEKTGSPEADSKTPLLQLEVLRLEHANRALEQDVAERKRIEAALREREEWLDRIVETIPDGVVIVDRDGHITFANAAAEAILGLTRSGITTRLYNDPAWKITTLEGQPFPDQQLPFRRVMASNQPAYDIEFVIEQPAGRRVTMSVNAAPLRDTGGRTVGMVAAFTDITAQKNAEAALLEREERLAKIVATAPGMVCSLRLRPDGSISLPYGAERIEEFYGLAPGRVGEDASAVFSLIHPDDVPHMSQSIAESARTMRPWRCEWRVRHPDRGELWLEGHSMPLREPDGGILWHGVVTDVTERKRADQVLLEKERLLSESQRIAHVGSWRFDLTGRLSWSDEMYRIYGVPPSSFTPAPESFLTLIHPEDRPAMQAWIAASLAGKRPGELEFRAILPDGSVRFISGRGELVYDAANRPTHLAGTAQDITERVRLQAQFLQSQKMESVGHLAGGIAHDFNNLLTVITGTADLALKELREEDPLCADFRRILGAGERAASLTRQLLAFSRKQIMKPQVVCLNAVVTDMRGLLERLIGEDIDLVVVPAKEVGNVRVDRGQIEQVILNLAVNARDAMPDGGKLTFETRDVELPEARAAAHPSLPPGRYVMLAISDTGQGMDEATRQRVFEPFFTTKPAGKGTGLGLSTAYGIIAQSGGSIRAYSEVGKGTVFKIYLPLVEEAVSQGRYARTGTTTRGTETILVVEDEAAVRGLAKDILESAGYAVLTAANGEEALRLVERHGDAVHLLLSDVVMPGMNGRDLAERLVRTRPQLKVLFTSGYTDDAILRHGVLDETSHFIGKPYTVADLTRTVREVLDA